MVSCWAGGGGAAVVVACVVVVVGCTVMVVGSVVVVVSFIQRRMATASAAAAAAAGGGTGGVQVPQGGGTNTNATRDGFCVYFMAANCRNGDACPYKHNEDEEMGPDGIKTKKKGARLLATTTATSTSSPQGANTPRSFQELVAIEESKGKSKEQAAKKVALQIASNLPKVGSGGKGAVNWTAKGNKKNVTSPTNSTGEECSICLGSIDGGTPSSTKSLKGGNKSTAVVQPPCQHLLHYQCALEWFEKGGPLCPVCNQDVRVRSVGGLTSAA